MLINDYRQFTDKLILMPDSQVAVGVDVQSNAESRQTVLLRNGIDGALVTELVAGINFSGILKAEDIL